MALVSMSLENALESVSLAYTDPYLLLTEVTLTSSQPTFYNAARYHNNFACMYVRLGNHTQHSTVIHSQLGK
jgi:hypothetical protein